MPKLKLKKNEIGEKNLTFDFDQGANCHTHKSKKEEKIK